MPPPVTMPSNLVIAAATSFRTLVNTIQETQDQGLQLRQTVTSLGEVANVLDLLATSTAAHEQQFGQIDQRVQNAQTAADEAKVEAKSTKANQPTSSPARKPLCESRSVANLKILGSKKEEFKNRNEKLINATTQVFGHGWRSFVKT